MLCCVILYYIILYYIILYYIILYYIILYYIILYYIIKSLRRADHSSRGVLSRVVCVSVISKPEP